ncbi:MAG: RimK family alpha-L-glutamate ligase [Saprospiraceae bacterium]
MNLTFGIVTVNSYSELNYEKQAIYDNAVKHFKHVLLIDPRKVSYQFIRGAKKPIIRYLGQNLANLSALHIRGANKIANSTSILAHSLDFCGCIISDPIYKFSTSSSSKLLATVGQYEDHTGSSSFIAFDLENTLALIASIEAKKLFPIIVKPINGRQGNGIYLLKTAAEMLVYTNQFFEQRTDSDIPIFLQTFVAFVKEYRIFVIDKKIIGLVVKIKQKGQIVANTAKGATFIPIENPQQVIVEFILDHLSDGIYGVDVAIDTTGGIHLIEANRSPNWKAFQQATGIDVAAVIIQDTLRKINDK